MIDVKRIVAFIVIIVCLFGAMIWTSTSIIKDIKLGLDLKGGFEILYTATPIDQDQELTKDVLAEAAQSVYDRAERQGISEPEVVPEGENRIRVRIAGVSNQEEVRRLLKKPAELNFRSADGCAANEGYCKIELQGNDFVEGGASVQYQQDTNQPYVSIKIKDAKKFEEITRRLTRKPLAIYLDGQLISDPVVNGVIPGGDAMISGDYTYTEASDLAGIINLGALPVSLEEIYTQSVGATLGKMSLDQTVRAGVIGAIIVLIFMIVFYRIPGMIASVTILLYSWLLLIVMGWMNATLTLPGIAAFVLGIGMAVDANIITYERIKEEIRSGKTILSSLKAGSRNSFRTIMDANVTTILAAFVLYNVGTGPIQGFSLVLIMSILVSLLTNVLISRLLLTLLIRSKAVNKPAYFGVKEAEISEL